MRFPPDDPRQFTSPCLHLQIRLFGFHRQVVYRFMGFVHTHKLANLVNLLNEYCNAFSKGWAIWIKSNKTFSFTKYFNINIVTIPSSPLLSKPSEIAALTVVSL